MTFLDTQLSGSTDVTVLNCHIDSCMTAIGGCYENLPPVAQAQALQLEQELAAFKRKLNKQQNESLNMSEWTKETPSEPGLYWWTDGVKQPDQHTVMWSEHPLHNRLMSFRGRYVDVMPCETRGGYWQKIVPPEMPKI